MRAPRTLRAALLAGCMAWGGVATQAETLTDTLILAYRHSGLLEKNRAVLRAADEDVAQAIATLRPIFTYAATVSRRAQYGGSNGGLSSVLGQNVGGTQGLGGDEYEDTASISISGDLLLWDNRRSALAVDVAKELVLVTRQSLASVEQQVLLNAVTAYLQVREGEAFVNLRRSNVALIGRELQAAQDRFEVGEVTRTDVALAESALAAARSVFAQAEGDLELARAQYAEVVGQPPGNLAEPTNLPPIAATLEEAQAIARTTHPDILRDRRLVTVAELNVERAERAVNPTIRATTSLGIDQDYQESATIGLQMTGPIYQGGGLTSLYRQAVANRDESRADLHLVVDTSQLLAASAWAQLQVSRARIEASQLEVRAADVAFRGLQEEAQLGARTTLDVLDAEQDLQDARANQISARTSEVQAIYELLSAMGLLSVEHLNLGVVTYDPSVYYEAVRDAPVRKVSPRGQKLDRLLRSLGKD